LRFMCDMACAGTAGRARALFSADTGSCETMVSCWAEVMVPASTRNWRFCRSSEMPSRGCELKTCVLDVPKGPVHHGISEAVGHDGLFAVHDVSECKGTIARQFSIPEPSM
jgi:hypothetical protein